MEALKNSSLKKRREEMSAKFLYSLSDENPDLQKQIGCMNGIFQLFDRHQFLGGRRLAGKSHKRLPPGQMGYHEVEPKNALQNTTHKYVNKGTKEKQRISTESSRTSCSSTCSSSFSSVDCNNVVCLQPEQTTWRQANFPEDIAKNHPNACLQPNPQTQHLRHIVKDSIYREGYGLSVKTTTTEEGGRRLKYIDSPRPLQTPKSSKVRVSGANESFGVLAKLQESPRKSYEGKDHSQTLARKDAPRFSYDERESRERTKSTIKLKDLPRLSLDSREGSLRRSLVEVKSNNVLGDLHREKANNIQNQQQEPGSYKRPSSVVAKLMGLEAFPEETHAEQIKTFRDIQHDPLSRSSRITDANKQNGLCVSPRNFKKEAISPRMRNAGAVKKDPANSKFPIEPAPWRQTDGSKSQTPALKCQNTPEKALNCSLTVYGEIEKRLADLEFKKSGKDLRALKQILEAMHKSQGRMESRNENQVSNLLTQTSNTINLSPNSISSTPRNGMVNSTSLERPTSSEHLRSSIVIVKPAKLVQKANDCGSSSVILTDSSCLHSLIIGGSEDNRKELVDKQRAKHLPPRANHLQDPSSRRRCSPDKNGCDKTLGSKQTSEKTHRVTGEIAKSSKSLGLIRQQHLGKQSPPTIPSSDSSRKRRQPSQRRVEASSPHRKPSRKSPDLPQIYNQRSDMSCSAQDFSHQSDATSLQSDSNFSLVSNFELEVTSTERTDDIDGINGTSSHKQSQKENPAPRLNEERTFTECAKITSEQPSPVSVLDTTFYEDESPSPVRKILHALKNEQALNSDELESSSMESHNLPNCKKSSFSSQNKRESVEIVQQVVQNLITDGVAPMCDSRNPDHRYILEILLASGLLEDVDTGGVMNIELHPSGHPVDPSLFLALEQTKARTGLLDEQKGAKCAQSRPIERIQRKLVFDSVNEFLAHKLPFEGSSEQWVSPSKLAAKGPKGQQLLRNLYSEFDCLQANNSNCNLEDVDDIFRSMLQKDLMHQSTSWKYSQSEISGIVLDIERLIFKDLINEVVHGQGAGLQGQPSGHCRKLFTK